MIAVDSSAIESMSVAVVVAAVAAVAAVNDANSNCSPMIVSLAKRDFGALQIVPRHRCAMLTDPCWWANREVKPPPRASDY